MSKFLANRAVYIPFGVVILIAWSLAMSYVAGLFGEPRSYWLMHDVMGWL